MRRGEILITTTDVALRGLADSQSTDTARRNKLLPLPRVTCVDPLYDDAHEGAGYAHGRPLPASKGAEAPKKKKGASFPLIYEKFSPPTPTHTNKVTSIIRK